MTINTYTYVSRSVQGLVGILSGVHVNIVTSELRDHIEEDALKHYHGRMSTSLRDVLCQTEDLHAMITTHSHIGKSLGIRGYLTEYVKVNLQA